MTTPQILLNSCERLFHIHDTPRERTIIISHPGNVPRRPLNKLSSAKCMSWASGRPGRPAPRPAGPVRSPERPSWLSASPWRPFWGPRHHYARAIMTVRPTDPGPRIAAPGEKGSMRAVFIAAVFGTSSGTRPRRSRVPHASRTPRQSPPGSCWSGFARFRPDGRREGRAGPGGPRSPGGPLAHRRGGPALGADHRAGEQPLPGGVVGAPVRGGAVERDGDGRVSGRRRARAGRRRGRRPRREHDDELRHQFLNRFTKVGRPLPASGGGGTAIGWPLRRPPPALARRSYRGRHTLKRINHEGPGVARHRRQDRF